MSALSTTNSTSDGKVTLQRKAVILSQEEEQGIVECIVSVFGVEDYGSDVMVKGCFRESLQRKYPKGVWMHDGTTPVARTLVAKELAPNDDLLPDELKPYGGLYIRGQFNMETQRGREAYSDIKFGIIDEFSIGFFPDAATTQVKNKVRYIKKAFLVEWSPVLMGMNPHTAVLAVKGGTMPAIETKGEYLGEHIEHRATVSACEAVINALFWKLYTAIYNDDVTLDEKIAQVNGMCAEAGTLIATIVTSLLQSATEEEMQTAGQELKSLFVDPAKVAPLTGVTLKTQVDLVLSANQSLLQRMSNIADWKAQKRSDKTAVLSDANRAHIAQQLQSLKGAVEAGERLLATTTPETKAIEATIVSTAWLKALAARTSLVGGKEA